MEVKTVCFLQFYVLCMRRSIKREVTLEVLLCTRKLLIYTAYELGMICKDFSQGSDSFFSTNSITALAQFDHSYQYCFPFQCA